MQYGMKIRYSRCQVERTHPDSVVRCSCRKELAVGAELNTPYADGISHVSIHEDTGIDHVNSNAKQETKLELTRYLTQFPIHLGTFFRRLLQRVFVHRDSS